MTGYQGTGMWVDPAADPRDTHATPRGEKEVLGTYLDHYRTTLELKCENLTPAQLATRSVPPSTLSLLGLIRHMARVEHHWFRRVLDGDLALPRLYSDDRDVPFDEAVGTRDCVEEAWTAWRREVSFAREWFAGCDDLGAMVSWDAEEAEVRDLIVHMIEEYARHCGHADLLRECLDGRTGQ